MENIRTVRQVRRKTEQATRYGRNTAQPFKKRTARTGGNGFLNHQFKPFWLFNGNSERAEAEYFRSLENLCKHYDLLMPDVTGLEFPQNVYRSWQITAERINAIDKKLDCIILKDENHTATLATITQYDTGYHLYYIPVKPLWNWSTNPKYKTVTEVMLSIFAYLYQVVEIPLYTEPDSYVGQQYSYMEDMINEKMFEDDEDKEFKDFQMGELFTLQNSGIHLRRLMEEKYRVENMEDIVLNYANTEEHDNELAVLAIEFVQLYKAYPKRSYLDSIRPDLCYPEVEERIYAEQYVSFYWSGYDSLIESVYEMINCHFQEMGVTDEPIDVKLFDSPNIETTERFGFENRLFPLINRLSEFLDNYDDYTTPTNDKEIEQ